MKTPAEVQGAMNRHSDTVWRICAVTMKNKSDAEDVFQEVFLKYLLSSGTFESDEHEKAWLIRVAKNLCTDVFRKLRRRGEDDVGEWETDSSGIGEENLLRDAISRLPESYRIPIVLFYLEGYSAAEISKLLKTRENVIYTRLSRARGMLKQQLGGDSVGVN